MEGTKKLLLKHRPPLAAWICGAVSNLGRVRLAMGLISYFLNETYVPQVEQGSRPWWKGTGRFCNSGHGGAALSVRGFWLQMPCYFAHGRAFQRFWNDVHHEKRTKKNSFLTIQFRNKFFFTVEVWS
jgi:hypothetical protein